MAQTELTWKSIGLLDEGRVGLMLNASIAKIIDDLKDRGDDGKPRSLEPKIIFTVVKGKLFVDAQVGSKMPAYQSNTTIAKIEVKPKADGGLREALVFQDGDASNPDQNVLFEADEDGEIEK